MPGSIHVSGTAVLEAVGPSAGDTEWRKFVCVKVSLGELEFLTRYKRLSEGKTAPWNSNFEFPVLNLTDRLVVAICHEAGRLVTSTAVEVPTILQAGFRDEYVNLDDGGRIHLKLSFVLSDEEKEKLNSMRAAAQRRQNWDDRDDILRSYDLKRKHDKCTDNGLRTIEENKQVYAGEALDNWEVLTQKKGKEVSFAILSAFPLPQPQPPQYMSIALGPPVADLTRDDVEHPVATQGYDTEIQSLVFESPCDGIEKHAGHIHEHNVGTQEYSIYRESLQFNTPSVEKIADPIQENDVVSALESLSLVANTEAGNKNDKHSPPVINSKVCVHPLISANTDGKFVIVPPTVQIAERLNNYKEKIPDLVQENDVVNVLESFSLEANTEPGNKNDKHSPPASDSEVWAHPLISSNTDGTLGIPPTVQNAEQLNVHFPTQAKHGHVVCQLPEMEECMEVSGSVQNTMRKREGLPSYWKKTQKSALTPKTMDLAANLTNRLWEEKRSVAGSTFQENTTNYPDLPNADLASMKILESLHVSKDVRRRSSKRTPNTGKDTPMQVLKIREERPKSLTLTNIIETGMTQHENNQGSSTFGQPGASKVSNAWVRVEANLSSAPQRLQQEVVEEDTGSKAVTSPTPVPMDGWICVERPPMTWEDALKVAQKARETSVDGTHVSSSCPYPSPLNSLSSPNFAENPLASQASAKLDRVPQFPAASSGIFSPLPLPPKQSPSRGRISPGSVKARIDAFEVSRQQVPDQSLPNLPNEKKQLEARPAGTREEMQDKRTAEEKLRSWEDKLRNWVKYSEDSVVPGEWRHPNQDPGKSSSRVDLRQEGERKDQESRLQRPRCDSHNLDIRAHASEERACSGVSGNMTTPVESRNKPKVWKLPLPEDIILGEKQSTLIPESLTETELLPAVDGRASVPEPESRFFLGQGNCGSNTHFLEREATEQIQCTEEKKDNAGVPLPVTEKTIHTDSDSLTESNVQSQDYSDARCPTNLLKNSQLMPPAPEPQPLAGDSMQAMPRPDAFAKERKSFLVPGFLNEDFQETKASGQWLSSNGIDDPYVAPPKQAANMFPENPSFGPLKSPPICVDSSKTMFDNGGGASNLLSHFGGAVKQILGGAVILAGVLAFWPRNDGPVERYHIVKAGETLSSIAPGQCSDPSSNFCRINPHICDQKHIYPGQRLRLS